MSRIYSVDIKLESAYNESNISKIVKNSFELNFIYYEPLNDQTSYLLVPIPKAKVLEQILRKVSNKIVSQVARFESTQFDLDFFASSDSLLNCSMSMEASRLLKESFVFVEDTAIDWSRYIRLLMTITNGFVVKEVETNVL
jgi:molybdopterin/thiamine biosynthesis adenylyltransferase